MDKQSHNKGEWSEFYVFLRSLDRAEVYAADSNLQRIEKATFAIREIVSKRADGTYHYEIIGDTVRICKGSEILGEFQRKKFARDADIILTHALRAKGNNGTIVVGESARMMEEYCLDKIVAGSSSKEDIVLVIRDNLTGIDREYPFSIKSFAGSDPTLVNASKSTNFIYRIIGNDLSEAEIEYINGMTNSKGHARVKDRIKTLKDKFHCELKYCGMENDVYESNLLLLDGFLPQTLAEMLLRFYEGDISSVKGITETIAESNPLDLHGTQPFYQFKVKKFLIESFTGMVPSKPWNGYEKTHGGYLVVKEDGEILCLHLNNRNEFEDYLYNSTKFDIPSVSRHEFAKIERDKDGSLIIKLNLQIRFTK